MASFALTIFTGAFLLFQIQPMIGKFILPWFGGGPGIWTTCMLFFQVALLGGYAYAHWLTRSFNPRRQVLIHLMLLGVAICLLPITPSTGWKPAGDEDPRFRILCLLAASVGLPYFALSATGPLLQDWFGRVRPGVSPYRLYALSNAGSLLALLSYPFYFETHLTRQSQALLWAWGLVIFVVGCSFCARQLWRATPPRSGVASLEADSTAGVAASPTRLRSLLWLLLPACASVLLLATTNKLCQDVTVIPLLWVLPLALYLLSFIICFDNPRWYVRQPWGVGLVLSLAAICWAMFDQAGLSISAQVLIYSLGLFICCLTCHGELYRLRPDPAHLTRFYLMIAAGGALGGVGVTLLAPLLFNDYHELHWGLLACALLVPAAWAYGSDWSRTGRWRWQTVAIFLLGWSLLAGSLWRQAHRSTTTLIERTRNFYGVLAVHKVDPSNSRMFGMELVHGGTKHGIQLLDPALSSLPTAYYHENTGVGRVLRSSPPGNRNIGVVGLGAGTLATYARSNDTLRLYEINPEVIRLAKQHFSYLSRCPAASELVLGDARLSLEREPPQRFDLLVLDAFSSDAVPMHLLTQEAFRVYEKHLKPDGVIAVHISNRHLDLQPVVARAAEHLRLQARLIRDVAAPDKWWHTTSVWVLLSADPTAFDRPLIASVSQPLQADPERVSLWTDDFASIYPILRSDPELKEAPNPAQEQISAALAFTQRGDFAEAAARYRQALDVNPDQLEALNNLAWLLASCRESTVRNGAEAVRLAERACELTEYRRTPVIGTLAAAYAEAGRFPEAIATAEKAAALAQATGDEVLLLKNRQLLELYRAGKPYHESQVPE